MNKAVALKKMTMDRRALRTRATLQQSLFSLILQKRYEHTTTDEIYESANVGRSTFYSHYASKDDLKRSGIEAHLRALFSDRRESGATKPSENGRQTLSFSMAMFEHARDHKHLHQALVNGRGGAVSHDCIRDVITDAVRCELDANSAKLSSVIPREIVVQYLVGAYMALLTSWLDGGAKLPPKDIDSMFQQLASNGLASLSS